MDTATNYNPRNLASAIVIWLERVKMKIQMNQYLGSVSRQNKLWSTHGAVTVATVMREAGEDVQNWEALNGIAPTLIAADREL